MPGTSLSENVVTYEEQILSRELPGSIVIAGAGAIGMEFAYVLTNYGVDVTIVEFLPRALPNEDAEVSKEIEKQYKKLGVKILTGTKVESIDDDGSTVTVTVSKDGKTEELKADKVLAGHRLRAQRRGLSAWTRPASQLTDRKAIEIDDYMRTNVPHIYAIGDVTGEAAAGARRRGAGRGRGRNHRRRRDFGARRLPDAAARDVLSAAGRQLRAHRAAGPRRGLRRQGREVPVHRQRQGARPRRARAASSS